MSRRSLGPLALALGLALLLAPALVGPISASHPSPRDLNTVSPAQRATMQSNYGLLPLPFEVNAGQADASVRFLAHGADYTLALTPSAALLTLAHSTPASSARSCVALPGQPAARPAATTAATILGMQWQGANPSPAITGEQPLPGTVNYFIGHDPAQWHTNIPTYQQVRLHSVYPGVDLVYYGNQGQLEYDFVVAPGADSAAIQLGFTGENRLGVDLAGNLSLTLPGGSIAQQKPLVYQTVNGARQPVAGGYALTGNQRVGFSIGTYNPHLPLVIDPAYKFSTYLGGTSPNGWGDAIAVDTSGNTYVTGYTDATNFPTHNPIQATNKSGGSNSTAFVSKFNAAGSALVYSTYLGGSGSNLCGGDFGNGIAVDASGNAYVVGTTGSPDFPTTAGAFRTSLSGCGHAFVTKLNVAGSALAYSTYLGGTTNPDQGLAIAVDASGDAYATGEADSYDFPTTLGAFQTVQHIGSAFVTKFNATGSGLVYSTLLSGSGGDHGTSIAIDGAGDAYVTGRTDSSDFPVTRGAFQTHAGSTTQAFATKFNAAGTALVYSTYLGGTSSYGEIGYGIAVDSGGSAYVTGDAYSTDFPTTPGAFQTTNAGGEDAFVTKLNAAGSALAYSTYLGGSSSDNGNSIAVDASGDAYVTGLTTSTNFPTASPLQAHNNSTVYNSNAFVTKLNPSGSGLLYSSYLGGSGNAGTSWGDYGSGIAVSWDETAYITGEAISSDFPVVNAFQSTNNASSNAFVTKIATVGLAAKTTGVFRSANGNLYLKNSNSTGYADITLDYGLPGDKPVTGDWIGQGYHTIGVDRGGKFLLRNSNTTGNAAITFAFGSGTDLPVGGDWTGKGYDSVGVFRNGVWYLRNTNTTGGADITVYFGAAGDLPVVGDWTGKGYDSVGVYRPSAGQFYLRNSNTTGPADLTVTFGASGDLPIAGDWTAKGYDSIGLYRSGTYLLRNTNSTGAPDISFTLGIAGDQPIAGPWLALVGGLPPVHRGPHAPGQHMAGRVPTRRSGG